jgi:hypothetical protein
VRLSFFPLLMLGHAVSQAGRACGLLDTQHHQARGISPTVRLMADAFRRQARCT